MIKRDRRGCAAHKSIIQLLMMCIKIRDSPYNRYLSNAEFECVVKNYIAPPASKKSSSNLGSVGYELKRAPTIAT